MNDINAIYIPIIVILLIAAVIGCGLFYDLGYNGRVKQIGTTVYVEVGNLWYTVDMSIGIPIDDYFHCER